MYSKCDKGTAFDYVTSKISTITGKEIQKDHKSLGDSERMIKPVLHRYLNEQVRLLYYAIALNVVW
jgi:hypothetical protein